MHIRFIIGFLGSGKTTLSLALARQARLAGQRVAIVVNEIGEIGIDNQVMRQLDLDVWELVNGCICCTLSGDLVSTLEKLDATFAPDLVIVEPSGAADPRSILIALPYYKGRPLSSMRSAVVIDPQRLEMLLEVLTPLMHAGLERADCIVISKADQATPEELAISLQAAGEIRPRVPTFCVDLTAALPAGLLAELLP